MKHSARLFIVLIFIGAGGIFYWAVESQPVETHLVFVLTDLEVTHSGQLLRHEHVRQLTCRVLDEANQEVGRIVHKRPAAVVRPSSIILPPGNYSLELQLTLVAGNNAPVEVRYLRQRFLDGGTVTVRP